MIHIHSNVFLLFLSSLPHYQAEYLIFRLWPDLCYQARLVFGLISCVLKLLNGYRSLFVS